MGNAFGKAISPDLCEIGIAVRTLNDLFGDAGCIRIRPLFPTVWRSLAWLLQATIALMDIVHYAPRILPLTFEAFP